MPLHISEIGIKMTISDAEGTGESNRTGSPCGGASPSGGAADNAQRKAIVEECVRSVLATLKLMERR